MNKTVIKAEVVADSLSTKGDRLTSLKITFPRIILAEVNTHRMLSKNTSSSRAIPFKKMVEAVQNDPFIHIAWQKNHSGMQGTEYFTDERDISWFKMNHLKARDQAVERATDAFVKGLTKQIVNRYLEPFMWTTMLITGSKEGWDNFFRLRCPDYQYLSSYGVQHYKSKKDFLRNIGLPSTPEEYKDWTDLQWLQINKSQAEIHIMNLAEKIYDAMNESTPEKLEAGMWHIPYMSEIDSSKLNSVRGKDITIEMVKISTAIAARESYTVVGNEKDVDYQKQIELHDRLIAQDPPHSSPLEHCNRAMTDEEHASFRRGFHDVERMDNGENQYWFIDDDSGEAGWCNNIKGFIPYRYMIDNNLKM